MAMAEDRFSNLPIDIIFDIFTRLPLKSISQCKWVSKSWYNFILNPRFADLHFSRFKHDFPCAIFPTRYGSSYLIDPESISRYETSAIVYDLNLKEFRKNFTISNGWNCGWNSFEVFGTVNGLVCFSPERCGYEPNVYYVVNPITRDYVLLPNSPKIYLRPVGSRFGFDSVKNEYKLVRILQNYSEAISEGEYENDDDENEVKDEIENDDDENAAEDENDEKKSKKYVNDGDKVNHQKEVEYGNAVEIYTLGSGTWREIQLTTDVPTLTVTGMRQSNVCVNGCLHWTPYVDIDSKQCNTIMSFHLSKEEFNLIRMPPVGRERGGEFLRSFDLIVLCEQLCLVDGGFRGDKDIWVMKRYGVHSSWVKEYVFQQEVFSCGWNGFHEVMELKNNELLLVNEMRMLSYYDRRKKISKRIMLRDLKGHRVQVETDFPVYLQGSILSPKAIDCVQ
ncbi:hypothetical protein ACHQM5_013526 [Ranunculus cassubicifolius]